MEIYRPSDANKWKDRRYRELTLAEKCVYDYWWDTANIAGFYKLSDTSLDVFCLGSEMTIDLYRSCMKSLTAPKEDVAGTPHRGWLRVGSILWCSHFLKHTQNDFGHKKDNQHKPVLKMLVSYYDVFQGEKEYIELLESIDSNIWHHFNIHNPLSAHKPVTAAPTTQALKPVPANIFDLVVKEWNAATGFNHMLNPFREKAIRERVKDGATIEDFKKVFNHKYNEWKDDQSMKKNLTLDTMLKEEHFHKYLEQSTDATTSETPSFIIE